MVGAYAGFESGKIIYAAFRAGESRCDTYVEYYPRTTEQGSGITNAWVDWMTYSCKLEVLHLTNAPAYSASYNRTTRMMLAYQPQYWSGLLWSQCNNSGSLESLQCQMVLKHVTYTNPTTMMQQLQLWMLQPVDDTPATVNTHRAGEHTLPRAPPHSPVV